MADEVLVKYNGMGLDFQKESENLLQEILSGFNQGVNAAMKNYTNLQNGYIKGYVDIVEQSKKANADMIGNINRNFGDLKSSVNNLYAQLQTNTTTAFDQSIAQFETQSEDIVKKFQGLDGMVYKNVVKNLKERYTKNMADFTRRYKETMDQLEQKCTDLVRSLKIPDIQAPNVTVLATSDDSKSVGGSKAKK